MNLLGWARGAGLAHKVVLYLPGTRDVSVSLSESEIKTLTEKAATFLSERFGGATAQQATGFYVAKDGSLVVERVTLVYCFAGRLSKDDRDTVNAFAAELASRLGQESVAVEVDRKLYFITP